VRTGRRKASGPHEGLPPWLHGPVQRWVVAKFSGSSLLGLGYEGSRAVAAYIALTHDIKTMSFDDDNAVVDRVIEAAENDPELCLDVVDATLRFLPEAETNTVLADTLALGGSAWMVAPDGKSLVRRIDPTAVEQFALATSPNHVASQKLAEAWGYAFGRQPNASHAWSDAIKAVEALLIPLVCPNK
jgi:hypothetical protein